MKLCSKTHQITPFKKISCRSMPPNPLANAWLRHASQVACNSPSPQKVPPPLGKSCIRPWTTTKKLFEEIRS